MRKNYVLLLLCAISFSNFDCIAMKKDESGGSVSQYAFALARLAQGVLSTMKGPSKGVDIEDAPGEVDPAQRKKRLIAGVLGALALTGGPTGYAAYAMSEDADSSDPVTFDNFPALNLTFPVLPEHPLPPSHPTHLPRPHGLHDVPILVGRVQQYASCCIRYALAVDWESRSVRGWEVDDSLDCPVRFQYQPQIDPEFKHNVRRSMPFECDVPFKVHHVSPFEFVAIVPETGRSEMVCARHPNHVNPAHRKANKCRTKADCKRYLATDTDLHGKPKPCIADPDARELQSFNVTGPIDELSHSEGSGD